MPKTYRLIDAETGEPVGLHVLADGLESSVEEVAEHAFSRGRGQVRVEHLADDKVAGSSPKAGPAASKLAQGPTGSGGISSAAAADSAKGAADAAAIETLVRQYRRAEGSA